MWLFVRMVSNLSRQIVIAAHSFYFSLVNIRESFHNRHFLPHLRKVISTRFEISFCHIWWALLNKASNNGDGRAYIKNTLIQTTPYMSTFYSYEINSNQYGGALLKEFSSSMLSWKNSNFSICAKINGLRVLFYKHDLMNYLCVLWVKQACRLTCIKYYRNLTHGCTGLPKETWGLQKNPDGKPFQNYHGIFAYDSSKNYEINWIVCEDLFNNAGSRKDYLDTN